MCCMNPYQLTPSTAQEGISVNRRAVRHLWENIQACGKPQFAGGLTQEFLGQQLEMSAGNVHWCVKPSGSTGWTRAWSAIFDDNFTIVSQNQDIAAQEPTKKNTKIG